MKAVAQFFIGHLPDGYPEDRLREHQGLKGMCRQLKEEDARHQMTGSLTHRAYPSGLVVRFVRRAIIYLNLFRIQVWIDELRDRMAFTVLKRSKRSLEEIATWRDHYYMLRFAYFAACLAFLPQHPTTLRTVLYLLSTLLLIDMFGGLAGSALVWHRDSISTERTFVTSLMKEMRKTHSRRKSPKAPQENEANE